MTGWPPQQASSAMTMRLNGPRSELRPDLLAGVSRGAGGMDGSRRGALTGGAVFVTGGSDGGSSQCYNYATIAYKG
jgi:hypothetical protein